MQRAAELAWELRGAEPEELEAALEIERLSYPEMIILSMHLRRAADPGAATVRRIALRTHPERLPLAEQRLLPEYAALASEVSLPPDADLAEARRAAAHQEARLAINSAATTIGLALGRSITDAERAAAAWLLRYCRHSWITCAASGIAALAKIIMLQF